jgi:hypothetical protein
MNLAKCLEKKTENPKFYNKNIDDIYIYNIDKIYIHKADR